MILPIIVARLNQVEMLESIDIYSLLAGVRMPRVHFPGSRAPAARAHKPRHVSLSFVLVKTFEIFTYICISKKLAIIFSRTSYYLSREKEVWADRIKNKTDYYIKTNDYEKDTLINSFYGCILPAGIFASWLSIAK